MREGDVEMTRLVIILSILAPLVHATISGTVINGTTGKPQSGVAINLVQPSQKGMQQLGTATSSADGTFSFDANPSGPGPVLLQSTYQTVTYSTLLQPNQPRTGVQALVYDSSGKRDAIAVDRHGILLEPAENQLMVREFIFLNNNSKTTYADNVTGTYRFFIPKEVEKVGVTITPPNSMPIQRPAEKTSEANVQKITFPIRPGQTQIELEYAEPLTDPMTFSGDILHTDGETRLIVPRGLSLEGEGLEQFAPEPRTQSPIFKIKPGPFTVKIVGRAVPQEPEDPDERSPAVQAHRPRIYDRYAWIMGLGLAIMTLSLLAMANRGTPAVRTVGAPPKPAKKK
jgi:hypothetical protein